MVRVILVRAEKIQPAISRTATAIPVAVRLNKWPPDVLELHLTTLLTLMRSRLRWLRVLNQGKADSFQDVKFIHGWLKCAVQQLVWA
ncbi:hypothetical protein D3C71_1650190 [compost metagenome]